MHERDRSSFFALLSDVFSFYRQDLSTFTGNIWWNAMQPFDFHAVHDALTRHCVNPDNGQFLPKPADVVRLLQGSTQDSALMAWSKVEAAIRKVGTHVSVTFDDAFIQQVLQDMGGWIALGQKKEPDWPFVRNEFVNRYRGYRQLGPLTTWPAVLVGAAEASNQCNGFKSDPPVLIGDVKGAQQIQVHGTHAGSLTVTRLDQNSFKQLSAPVIAALQAHHTLSEELPA